MTTSEKAVYVYNPNLGIQSQKITIYKSNIDTKKILKDIKSAKVNTTNRKGEIVNIPLLELKRDSELGAKSLYTGYIFPSNWSKSQILNWVQPKQPKSKRVTSPEVSPQKDI